MPRQRPGLCAKAAVRPHCSLASLQHPCQKGTACHQRGVDNQMPRALPSQAAMPYGSMLSFTLFDGQFRGSQEEQAGGKIKIDTSPVGAMASILKHCFPGSGTNSLVITRVLTEEKIQWKIRSCVTMSRI